MNKMPLRRIGEVAGINEETLYRKINFLHRQCLLFAASRERILPEKQIRRLYVGVDCQDYVINWTSSSDRRNITLHAVAAADNTTGYVFGTHVNFDPSLFPAEIEKEAETAGDYSADPAFSLYAIKVASTAGKKKATLFLRREVIVGSIHYQIKEREGSQ